MRGTHACVTAREHGDHTQQGRGANRLRTICVTDGGVVVGDLPAEVPYARVGGLALFAPRGKAGGEQAAARW